jgi:myo-inositol-1(or 4)-monophosphatase
MLDIEKAWKVSQKAALLGREVLLDYFGNLSKVSEKNQAGLVSEADQESERIVTNYLRSEFPEMAVLGEEASFHDPNQRLDPKVRQAGLWMIDPLDGTTNYVHKFPIYCVSIGLEYRGELVIGTVDVPVLRRTYTAARGHGAYVEGELVPGRGTMRETLGVSSRQSLSESLLATGFSTYDKAALKDQLAAFSDLVGDVRGIRRAGSAAFDLCLVAEGVFDAYWEKNLSAWDTAAGALLVREAGGLVSTYLGATGDNLIAELYPENVSKQDFGRDARSFTPFDKSIVAGSPVVHALVQKRIQKFLSID